MNTPTRHKPEAQAKGILCPFARASGLWCLRSLTKTPQISASLFPTLAVVGLMAGAPSLHAQKTPEAGYVFPAGGKAGTTVEVRLGGYDWTPDMEFFVHDQRVQAPGPTARPARFSFPAAVLVRGERATRLSAAASRGAGQARHPGRFAARPHLLASRQRQRLHRRGRVHRRHGPEVVEDENRKSPQLLPVCR